MLLQTQQLSKAYSGHHVLSNLSLTFEGGINYLVAPNGTGKSTLLKLIAGIENKDSGKILFNGYAEKFADYGSYVPDKMTMYPFITGQEFLDLVCCAKHVSREEMLISSMVKDLGIIQYLNTQFSKMSLGTQKKYFIVAALIGDFSCLLMDEPSNAIDKPSIEIIISYLKQLAEDKLIIIATHDQYLQSKLPGKIIHFSGNQAVLHYQVIW
jgi:ABC-2 type transport system ATP-binding protein